MSTGINRVFISGTLGADPELKHTQGGQAMLKLRVAVGERRKDGDQWKDHTEWFSAVLWDKRAEGVAKHLSKGSQVTIEGKLRTRPWEDANGNKRYSTDVSVDEIVFSSGRRRERSDEGPAPGAADAGPGDPGSDDISFATVAVCERREHRTPKWERF